MARAGIKGRNVELDVSTIGQGTKLPVHRVVMLAAAMAASALSAKPAEAQQAFPLAGIVANILGNGQPPMRLSMSSRDGYVPLDGQPRVIMAPPEADEVLQDGYRRPGTAYDGQSGYDAPQRYGDAYPGRGYAQPRPPVPEPSESFMRLATVTYMRNTGVPLQVAANVVERMHVMARDCARDLGPARDCNAARGGISFSYGGNPTFAASVMRLDQGGLRQIAAGAVPVVMETPGGVRHGPAFEEMLAFERSVDQGYDPASNMAGGY